MKFLIGVNQKRALELGIRNINQGVIFDLLTGLSTWATPVVIADEVFYWVARQVVCDELTLLDLKPDTVYRHFKSLHKLGLIVHVKVGKKDCIKLTEKGKSYYVGFESEKGDSTMSDLNPKNGAKLGFESEKTPKLGNRSENNSDLNPTYQVTKNKSIKAAVSNNVCEVVGKSDELAAALGFFKNEKQAVIFSAKLILSSRVQQMLFDWVGMKVTAGDVDAVMALAMARGVEPRSPMYLEGLMQDRMAEKSGVAKQKREALKVPRDDEQLASWARKHGFSGAKVGEHSPDYRGRLLSEVRSRGVGR